MGENYVSAKNAFEITSGELDDSFNGRTAFDNAPEITIIKAHLFTLLCKAIPTHEQ